MGQLDYKLSRVIIITRNCTESVATDSDLWTDQLLGKKTFEV